MCDVTTLNLYTLHCTTPIYPWQGQLLQNGNPFFFPSLRYIPLYIPQITSLLILDCELLWGVINPHPHNKRLSLTNDTPSFWCNKGHPFTVNNNGNYGEREVTSDTVTVFNYRVAHKSPYIGIHLKALILDKCTNSNTTAQAQRVVSCVN